MPGFTESPDGEILFVELPYDQDLGGIPAILHRNRPLNTYRSLSGLKPAHYNSFARVSKNDCIGSVLTPGKTEYALYHLDPGSFAPGEPIYTEGGHHLLEPVQVAARQRARKLPSAVRETSETGLLLCQDINVTALESKESSGRKIYGTAVRITSPDGSFQDIPAERDGSVYLELSADHPFRIHTLDQDGRIIHGPSSWFWVRPNERRGCVGCHADHELAPVNRVPLAVKKPPVRVSLYDRESTQKGVSP
jgi:hypothetical protein